MDNQVLEGKVALVTGAGRGVGRDIALMMAARGAKVIVNDLGSAGNGDGHDQGPAMDVVREIQAAGGEAAANLDSVADFKAAKGMVEQAMDTFGGLDIVVNNAGNLRDVIFHKMTEEDFDLVIGVHLKGAFNTSRNAADIFRAQKSGCFVHMTSTSGLIGNIGQANYMSAKMGITGLSKSIALDMGRYGVRSNCIAPFAWSRMIESIPITSPEQAARVEKLRQMTPDKIATVATALAAAKDVSGQIFTVRNNEIFLMSQSRPIRGMQRSEGWDVDSVLEHAFPAMAPNFYDLDVTADVFSWDPV